MSTTCSSARTLRAGGCYPRAPSRIGGSIDYTPDSVDCAGCCALPRGTPGRCLVSIRGKVAATCVRGGDAVTSAEPPDSAMDTGSDAGEPGERRPVDLEDLVAAAAEDEAPL